MPTQPDDGRIPYHHGRLRRALIDATVTEVARAGTDRLSLRKLARQAGVSHAAPQHHFGDRTGLLTAVAAEGFRTLTEQYLRPPDGADDSFLTMGTRYVEFAVTHPGYFHVMYRPDLCDGEDPELAEARASAAAVLQEAAQRQVPGRGGEDAAVAAWALMHGLATLWLGGNLERYSQRDPAELARAAGSFLFSAPPAP
ncbi:TetR/AcrR family transcriptional regulator [Georgenia sp. 10Sc9-8]|uniref:TetR/AcrR family transcriptional regulator n=1 Tax=Georgenia halotolerans TaxID=3028317 RepID=A0ABT5TVW6_9MICO|nr:TetR/AcrR family transcriptional regulator [Georgenia halotolerans]